MIHDLQFHAIKAIAERRREEQARELGIDPLQLYYREQAEKLIRERNAR